MRVLVVGSGGREHALAWKLSLSTSVSELFAAPGNAGTAAIARNLPIAATDLSGLVRAAGAHRIDLVVVGPEVPLSLGLVDQLCEAGIAAFGPCRNAARLESSKAFAHDIMRSCGIPAADARVFTSFPEAREFVAGLKPPIVVKADGLAAGKGAVVAQTTREAEAALDDMLVRRVFGEAGDRVVIEEYLEGREVSLLAFTDGTHVIPMVPACDYKRVKDNDVGPNTGGMGSYSPPAFFGADMVKRTVDEVITPVVRAMAANGWEYRGVLYAGLMVEGDRIRVLEFNARFGDPETQTILPRLEGDLGNILMACANGTLDTVAIGWKTGPSVAVVLASGGYPGNYAKGLPISGLGQVDRDVSVFHAGTTTGADGRVMTDGGRVLAVVATADTMAEARERVYNNVIRISFPHMAFRTDIALREVA